jgi:hypothetical protein
MSELDHLQLIRLEITPTPQATRNNATGSVGSLDRYHGTSNRGSSIKFNERSFPAPGTALLPHPVVPIPGAGIPPAPALLPDQ